VSLNVLTRGEGRPLVLLHGFTGSAGSWSLQLDGWAARHRIIAPDLLGHGGSEAPAEPDRYALGAQASDLADLVELLEAAPADVVGYSMGARLALVLTLQHPEVVGRLILESPSAGVADAVARAQRRDADEALAREIERLGIEAFVERWERMPLFATHDRLPAEVQARLRQERLGHDPVGLAASLRGAGQGSMEPLHERLGQIEVPTQVLAGSLDEVGIARARVVSDAIPDAGLEIIAGSGHTPHLEQPDAFVAAVDRFLAESYPPASALRKDP
jgi:2-succinyl-6-hydroxy-2,4-cyclohexadiene-1-carboxylate synthase